MILIGLLLGVVWFVFAALEYIIGRILFPEMGLTAPGYWTWFWVTFFAMVAGAIAELFKLGIKEAS